MKSRKNDKERCRIRQAVFIEIYLKIRYTKGKTWYGGFFLWEEIMARTVAIGLQDFGDLIQKKYFYIDKTSSIKEWWDSGDDEGNGTVCIGAD